MRVCSVVRSVVEGQSPPGSEIPLLIGSRSTKRERVQFASAKLGWTSPVHVLRMVDDPLEVVASNGRLVYASWVAKFEVRPVKEKHVD